MSRDGARHPAHSFSGHRNRSESQELDAQGPDAWPADCPPDLDPTASERHDWPLPPPHPTKTSEPTAEELAETLLGTTHAFKQWGNLCFTHAEPELQELSVPRARLLAAVGDAEHSPAGRVRMGDLSSALRVTARNITTIVDALEREGLLARKADPTDRRAILLELTEKGRAHVEHIHALQRDLAERMFAPLSRRERQALYMLLTRLAGHVAELAAASRKPSGDPKP
jgi:DNA-binding MarR family transcriptional regulator